MDSSATSDWSPTSIRPADPGDAAQIRDIRNEAVRSSLAIWTAHEHTIEEATAWLVPVIARGTALVAATQDGTVQGFALASPWHSYEGYAHTVEDSVYLVKKARGQGLGSRLLDGLIDACRTAGDRTVVAQIEAGNTASIVLHQQAGFQVVGTIPAAGDKYGQVLDLTLMSMRL